MDYVLLGRLLGCLLGLIYEPTLLAFAAVSNEPTCPKTAKTLDRFGVPRRIPSFALPLGYSFDPGGSMVYQAFVVLFIT